MTPLQREFFDMVVADSRETIKPLLDEKDWQEFKASLEIDVSGMNAAELRHNIKVWKETE
jgi:hypothetical protein